MDPKQSRYLVNTIADFHIQALEWGKKVLKDHHCFLTFSELVQMPQFFSTDMGDKFEIHSCQSYLESQRPFILFQLRKSYLAEIEQIAPLTKWPILVPVTLGAPWHQESPDVTHHLQVFLLTKSLYLTSSLQEIG